MNARRVYVTQERRRREPSYRARLRYAFLLSLAAHLLLAVAFRPLSDVIPLVRHIGYHGPLEIMPEISVIEEQEARAENPVERLSGAGSPSFFEVVPIQIVDWSVPSSPREASEQAAPDQGIGDDVLQQMETSLPQPTSEDVVIRKLVKPLYPRSSIEAGVEGIAIYRLYIRSDGTVRHARLVYSDVDRACELAAYRAALEWKFRPYVVGGAESGFIYQVPFRFRLTGDLVPIR